MRLWEQKVPQIILNNHETTKNELLTSFYYIYDYGDEEGKKQHREQERLFK